jgi:alpha-tubulin suppressor-like RCC1 family protein
MLVRGRAALKAALAGGLLLAAAPVATVATAGGAAAAAAPGVVWEWGSNGFGQLGNGAVSASPSGPAAVSGLSGVVDVHGGREHVAALTSSGQVYTWGSNQEGQLGLGDSTNRSQPTPVPGLSDETAVEAGHNHTLVLRSNGTVWAFGLNASGQLGDGTTTLRRSPVQVKNLTGVVDIAAGRDMSYAIRSDGTAWAWGANSYGELGDGTTTNRSTPVQIKDLTNVVGIAGGRDHGLALRGDGTVFAFGWNAYGQLGDGTTTNRSTPVQVTTGVTQVIAGAHHSYALRTDGQVYSWGRNYRAELGDGTMTQRTRPVLVHNVSNAVSIGSGRDHGVAVLANGTVQTWGYNVNGQLGDGTTTSRTSAVAVPGVTGAELAGGGGGEYSVVLVGSGSPQPSPPTARIGVTCSLLDCTFDGSGSSDADGNVTGYAWAIDGTPDPTTDPVLHHTFGSAGTHTVSLTVTDNDNLTGSTSTNVTVSDSAPPASVTYHGAKAFYGNVVKPSVTMPSGAVAGDRLVLFVTTNRAATATTPSGWTLATAPVSDGTNVRSWVFTRAATAAGGSVTVPLDAISKVNLTVLAYDGAGAPNATGAPELGSTTQHKTPNASVATTGSTVVSYWADRSSTVHGWTFPTAVTSRATGSGTGGGLVSSATGDTASVPAGTWAGATATSGVSSANAVMWSVVVPPA